MLPVSSKTNMTSASLGLSAALDSSLKLSSATGDRSSETTSRSFFNPAMGLPVAESYASTFTLTYSGNWLALALTTSRASAAAIVVENVVSVNPAMAGKKETLISVHSLLAWILARVSDTWRSLAT